MRPLHILSIFSLLYPLRVFADVQFPSPAAGSSFAAGAALPITWAESGQGTSLSQLTNYVINLCAGGNAAGSFQCSLGVVKAGGAFADGNVVNGVVVQPTWGQDAVNGYFLQIVSTSATGGQIINYSSRFTLTSLTGSLPATLITSISSLPAGTTAGPASSSNNANADSSNAATYANSYAVPYTLQTGPTRYAPMQPHPGTQITKTGTPTPLFPTSAATVASTFLPPAGSSNGGEWATTVTQSGTFSVSSMENQATPASHPTQQDPMKRWLERWKD